MSKVNAIDICVGDLVEYTSYSGLQKRIGYVDKVVDNKVFAYWSGCGFEDSYGWMPIQQIISHWKVINFEEEAKMDELKVYTGKDTIEALLEGKTISWSTDQYRLEGSRLLEKNGPNEWSRSYRSLDHFMKEVFTEVATPQVGDWVRVTQGDHTTTGQITSIEDDCFWAKWDSGSKGYYRTYSTGITWEILTPEKVSEYKREQAFVKVGRKPNEFRPGDIVVINESGIFGVVISRNGTREIRINKFNERKGYTAKPHQLTPISFVENQVSLD